MNRLETANISIVTNSGLEIRFIVQLEGASMGYFYMGRILAVC